MQLNHHCLAERWMSELSYIVTQDSKNRNKMEAIDQKINDALEQANQLKINSEEKKIVDDIKANYKNYVQVSQQVLGVPRVESTRLGQETFVPTGSAIA
ncbi:MAG: hypothetical protein VR66_13090 [Peptococcaceae bacterium BRH_c23]|nr:MAG: hypothetical protein VR66_13090 [Peptococcaceae bacterium BRH_c23]